MEKQGPGKKQTGRTNAFMILAGGYLLYLAYQLITDIGESDYKALSIGAAVVFAVAGSAPMTDNMPANMATVSSSAPTDFHVLRFDIVSLSFFLE